MSLEIQEIKARLRSEIKERLRAMSEAERRRQSVEIIRRIETHPVWQASKFVLFYAPLAREADIWPLFDRALAAKKRIALPRNVAEDDTYELVEVRDAVRDCERGRFGVREPKKRLPPIRISQLDLILVPGLLFDHRGGRLGRGKGHYDRLLSQSAASFCGIAFAEQMVAETPMGPHDVRMNCIVTPEGWLEASRSPVME